MRVCVTGATGLIGGALLPKLRAAGATVSALVRSADKARTLASAGVEVTVGDVTDSNATAQAIRGAEVVFHLAAKVNATGSLDDFVETNVRGTECVLEAAAASGSMRRVVHVSSIAVYGRIDQDQIIDESTPLDPEPARRDSYSHSKILAERSAVEFAKRTGLPLTVVRPGIVYGSGHKPPAGLVAFRALQTYFVFGQPEWHVPLIFVENLVDSLAKAATQPASAGLQDFNVVDDDALTLGGYLLARNKLERSRSVFLSPNPVLAAAAVFGPVARAITSAADGFSTYQLRRSLQDRPYSTRKIREELGWSPRVGLADALEASLRAG
jgi:nucleoside-diphosphate-sugar epimerase